MGVKELWKRLGYAEKTVNLTEVALGKVIGIDTSYLLHMLVTRTVASALYADKPDSLVAAFMGRVRQMRELNLQVLLVLEGPTAAAKAAEKRSGRRPATVLLPRFSACTRLTRRSQFRKSCTQRCVRSGCHADSTIALDAGRVNTTQNDAYDSGAVHQDWSANVVGAP